MNKRNKANSWINSSLQVLFHLKYLCQVFYRMHAKSEQPGFGSDSFHPWLYSRVWEVLSLSPLPELTVSSALFIPPFILVLPSLGMFTLNSLSLCQGFELFHHSSLKPPRQLIYFDWCFVCFTVCLLYTRGGKKSEDFLKRWVCWSITYFLQCLFAGLDDDHQREYCKCRG